MKRIWGFLACLLLIVLAGIGGWRLAHWTTMSIDPTENAAARVGVQVWAAQNNAWTPTTSIKTLLQYEGCSTMNVTPPSGDIIPVVTVRKGTEWKASRAFHNVNDADAVHSLQDCLDLYQDTP